MFRHFFREMPDRQKPGPSAGSGFIIESDGYILTNNHVVDGAEEIIVALSDRREREAVIVGQDALSDLAVLKIEGENLPTLDMGSSDSLEAGQWVVAIGSPFGFEHSVTAGIVSATGRSLPENNGNYVPFIQTDVAINPGNSGGPLLDLNGKVVGINSQILTRSGGFMGLSFAIPIDVAMEVAEQLKEQGVVSRGWLGVLIQRVDRDLAESFGLDRPAGALVTQVFADSPAEEGGLHQGDIILSFNGKMIDLSSDLPHLVGRARAESVATLEIMRSAKRQKIEVTIGKLGIENIGPQSSNSPLAANGNRIGIDIVDLEDVDKRRLEVSKGVLISQVYSGPAREAGIQRGDVLTDIDGEAISSAEQLERLVAALPGDISVHIRIVRNKRPQYLALKVPVM
jgi:serine protease Do